MVNYVTIDEKLLKRLRELLGDCDDADRLAAALKELDEKDVDLVLSKGETVLRDRTVRVGELEIDLRRRIVKKNGAEVALTPKEFDILYFLFENRGEVFTKEAIYNAVWKGDYLMDDSNIMAFIRKLRKKIEDEPDSPNYILTVWGVGYKFNDQPDAGR